MNSHSRYRLVSILLPICVLLLVVAISRLGKHSDKADQRENAVAAQDTVAADADADSSAKTDTSPKRAVQGRLLRGKNSRPTAPTAIVRRQTSQQTPVRAGTANFLTAPAQGDPLDIALDHVRAAENSQDHTAADFADPKISNRYVTKHNGVTHIYLRQRHAGIEVYNGDLNVNVMADGSIINMHNGFIADVASEVNRVDPLLSAEEAISSAATHYKRQLTKPLEAMPVTEPDAVARKQLFTDAGVSLDPIPAKLVYLPLADGSTRLAWNTVIRFDDHVSWLDLNVDAETGAVLSEANWISHANYNVYPQPVETPSHGGRAIVTDPFDATASPFGWHDTNGAAGAEFTDTRGNNVNAQEDADANNSGGTRPNGGAALNFDFPINLANRPDTYLDAVTTNLFYWNNVIHDILWHYGFDEDSGNFQENNYGNGGVAGDPVEADAQDGSGTNNANFGTPPDGSNPRMQMFIWTQTNPNRDSSIDNGIIIHEYGHGISNRLTGGAANSSALSANQSRGMGEGWSDWFGLALTAKPGDSSTSGRGIGTYVLGQATTGPGIRPFRYNTDMNANPQTFGNLNGGGLSVPHGIGSVWCTTLWEVYWALVDAYGFDADLYNGTSGNNIAIQLVIDGMKLQPATPTYLDARDAIIMADQVNNGGANFVLLWTAFAKRGMGASAFDGGDPNSLAVVEAFDVPDDLNITPGAQDKFLPSGKPGGPFVPTSRAYTLTNNGAGSLDWTASINATAWLDISAVSGTLDSGDSTTVNVSLNVSADSLAAGAHQATVSFTNLDSGLTINRDVVMAITEIAEAVDEPSLSFSSDVPLWYRQTVVSHDGVDAAQSGNVVDGQTTWMETTVTGPDTVNFFWKVDSEVGGDFLRFLSNGVVQESISGDVDWNRISYDVPAGDHVLRWEYTKNGFGSVGADSGWVDEVAVASLHPEPLITSDLNALVASGEFFNYQITATKTPTSYSSTTLPLGVTLIPSTGLITGTPTVVGNYEVDITATNLAGSSTETLTIVVYDFSEALDESGLTFTSDSPLWFTQSAVTHDGVDAAQAGDVNDSETSYIETTVTGPDFISFYWKVDSEAGWDYLRFLDNGALQDEISGDVDWTRINYEVPSGTHVLRWEYVKDVIISAGADTGWLDEFILASAHPEPIIYSNLSEVRSINYPFAYQIRATMDPTSYASSALPTGIDLSTTSGLMTGFPTVAGVYPIDITATNASGTDTKTLILTIDDLSATVNEPTVPISTSATPRWFTQTAVSHDGVSAAQAGDIDDNETTWMEATVIGPDTLTFFWKVESEGNWDYLRFFDNGSQVDSMSGFVDWTEVTYEIPEGSHTLRWEYDKDGSVSTGADTGWVDEIFFDSLHPEPRIFSELRVNGAVNDLFSYQIVATKSPTSYLSSPLPAGLLLNSSTGEISGVPTVAGSFPVQVTATNGSGFDTETLTIELVHTASFPFMETFEGGDFQPIWVVTGTGAAQTICTQSHSPHAGSWHSTMDTTLNTEDARNELTLAMDLTGKTRVVLRFWAKDFGKELDGPPPVPFPDGADFDGVAISEDGKNWYEVQPLRNEISTSYSQFEVDLDDAIAAYGLEFNSTFRIRFNHYDNFTVPNGGFAFDDVTVGDFGPEIAVEDSLVNDLDDGVSSVSYGTTNIGASSDHVFKVLNVGTEPLTGLSASFSGTNAGDFSAAAFGSTSLNPGETTTVAVSFAPGALGARSGTLHIASNDADENPFDIALSGDGTDSDIVVEFPLNTVLTDGSDEIDFGDKAITSTTAHTLTIRNMGTTPLDGLSTLVVGPDAAQFSTVAPPTSIDPGESATFQVAFTPLVVGSFTATLQIVSNDTDESPFDIALVGNGLSPEIVVEFYGEEVSDGSTVTFEDLIGPTPSSRTLIGVIRNTGPVPLLGLETSIDGPDASEIISPGLGNATLNPGESRQLFVLFNPSGYGDRTANLHISSNDADENPFDLVFNAARLNANDIGSFADFHGLTGDARLTTSNADGDELNLLEEYAYNMDPTVSDSAVMEPGGDSGLPLIRMVGDRLQVEYLRRRGDPSLSYSVEFGSELSDDPPDGFDGGTGTETVTSIDGDFQRVIVTDTVSSSTNSARFGRVKVTYTEPAP